MKKTIVLVLTASITLAAIAVIKWLPPLDSPATINLDGTSHFQVIDGWAAYPRYWEDDKTGNRFDRSFEPYIDEVSEVLVNEVGINAVRVEIWSGLENPEDYWIDHYEGRASYSEYGPLRYEKVNDNADPYAVNLNGFQFSKFDHRMEVMTLPIKRALEARDEQLYINVNYIDFSWNGKAKQGSLSHAENPEEFAEFVLVFFQRLKDKYGITPDSFEMILEPDNSKGWRGTQIGEGLVAVAQRLKENGFTPEFVGPSTSALKRASRYFDEMIKVPGVLDVLGNFSYHRYGHNALSLIEGIRARSDQHNLKTAMLEKIGAGIDVLFEDLTVANVSSWQQWATAGKLENGDHGSFYTLVDTSKPEPPRVTVADISLQLSQVFQYVRRGAVRIGANSNNSDKAVVAFINSNGEWVTIIRAKQAGGVVNINGLPAGTYGTRFIDDQQQIESGQLQVVGEGETLDIHVPRAGAMTVYAVSG